MASMRALLTQSFDSGERSRLAGLFGSVGVLHVVGWGLLLVYGANHPGFIWLGGVAYMLGLRHAFDADHISASTTRPASCCKAERNRLASAFSSRSGIPRWCS